MFYKTRHISVKRLISMPMFLLLAAALLFAVVTESQAAVGNGKIAFKLGGGKGAEIYTMNADGSDTFQLTDNDVLDGRPAWSPDGTKIAFRKRRDEKPKTSDIWVMNADGTDPEPLTDTLDESESDPAWSPDGTKIAFKSNLGGAPWRACNKPEGETTQATDIWVMNADGTDPEPLTTNVANDSAPTWSPDGTEIAFESDRGGVGECIYEIWVKDTVGGDARKLTNNPNKIDSGPSWSPDGTRIAYTICSSDGTLPRCNEAIFKDIWVMNSVGTGNTLLTGATLKDRGPAWSPDGSKIAFLSARGGLADIYLMNTDGSGQQNITNTAVVNEAGLSWQPIFVADPPPGPTPPGPTPPGPTPLGLPTAQPQTLLFKLTNPKLKRSKRKRIRRKTLYNYMKRGFKGQQRGYKRVEAYLLRVKKSSSKKRSRKAAKSKTQCNKIHRSKKRVKCTIISTNGVVFSKSVSSTDSTVPFNYKPMGTGKRSKQLLKKLRKGKSIRRGGYELVFKAFPRSGGKTKTFKYKLTVR